MKRFFLNIVLWFYLKFHAIAVYIGIALFNTEEEILKADPNNLGEDKKHTQRMRSRNQVLEKFYAGQTDEKYVKDYYEILKKADKFMKTATPHQMAVATNKTLVFNKGNNSYDIDENYRSNKKDKWGRRYEHYGFFDDKHKHAGKTLGEVLALEFEERRTKDDDYEMMSIFSNRPVEVGLKDVFDSIGEKTRGYEILKGDDDVWDITKNFPYSTLIGCENNIYPPYISFIGFKVNSIDIVDINKVSKQFKFPIIAVRENEDCKNKIEELTEFLHVKKIGFEYRQLEFFIPLDFKTNEYDNDSDIFKEIIDFQQIFIRGDYGELIGFGVEKLIKRIKYNDTHEVLKFRGNEIENMGRVN